MSAALALPVRQEYARRLRGLLRFAVTNGLDTVDDVFAHAASDGRFSAAELAAEVRRLQQEGDHDRLRTLLRGLNPVPLRQLLHLQANQPQYPDREAGAVAVLEAVILHGRPKALTARERALFLDLIASPDRRQDLDRYLADFGHDDVGSLQSHLLRANACNPFLTGAEDRLSPGVPEWLDLLNWMYLRDGLEPLDLAPGGQAPLDRLLCAPSSVVDEGPLVTIVIPTYNPGPSLATALESLLAQSYRRFEILIMDDGSPPEVAARLSRWEARDPRISVVPLGRNRGTYYARNDAVSIWAKGDFITIHDDDDWSHPRKLELQLAHLLAEPDVPVNLSLSLRVTPRLRVLRRRSGPAFAHSNFSSLLFRREVFERVGYWDLVNRGADGEMHDRLVAVTGTEIPVASRAPLSFLRMHDSSLSFGELNRGYVDPRRRWYQESARAWHRRQLAVGSLPYLPADGIEPRAFPAPSNMVGARSRQQPPAVDVLYATDYRFPGGSSTLACNEIEILLSHGYTVGLVQIDSPLVGGGTTLHPRAVELANHPSARVLTVRDTASASLAIVRHPTVLQFLPAEPLALTTDTVVLIVNHAPFSADRQTAAYDMGDVIANATAAFGTVPVVAPESGLIRRLLDGLVDPALLSPRDWNGVMKVVPSPPRVPDATRLPRLGRHSRDHPAKWPAAEDLRLVYPTDGSRDVRVLGGAGHAEAVLGGPVPQAWTVYPFGSRAVPDFLAELDFWVYFHSPNLYESFGMATLEAMAAGLVVILPPVMETTFGDGAVYAEPSQVGGIIDALWSDPGAYRRQSERAIRTAIHRFGEETFLERVRGYLP